MDSAELMGRYCDGDAGAFRQLYAFAAPRLYGYLAKVSGDRALAADLLQLTFLKVHRARAAYVRGADPMPWIYAIAHRTFIDETRKRRHDAIWLGSPLDPEQSPATDLPSDGGARAELLSAALAALSRLPAEQRQAVVLMKLEGKSLVEAAEIAGTSVGAMKVRAHRGYKALRQLLDHEAVRAITVSGAP